ncbi:hypothetical protein IW147_000896 [Coemansia sp. RSA 720]|nr:hypothetical protein IW147_000896 [Coemansia sp. RSA 720]
MSEVNSVGQSLASFVQSIIVDVTNFNGQVVQQLSVVEQLINIDTDVRQTQLLKQNKLPTRVQSADAQPIEYMDESEFVHQTATAAHSMSPQSTLHA